jgi:hypothetical protein
MAFQVLSLSLFRFLNIQTNNFTKIKLKKKKKKKRLLICFHNNFFLLDDDGGSSCLRGTIDKPEHRCSILRCQHLGLKDQKGLDPHRAGKAKLILRFFFSCKKKKKKNAGKKYENNKITESGRNDEEIRYSSILTNHQSIEPSGRPPANDPGYEK